MTDTQWNRVLRNFTIELKRIGKRAALEQEARAKFREDHPGFYYRKAYRVPAKVCRLPKRRRKTVH